MPVVVVVYHLLDWPGLRFHQYGLGLSIMHFGCISLVILYKSLPTFLGACVPLQIDFSTCWSVVLAVVMVYHFLD